MIKNCIWVILIFLTILCSCEKTKDSLNSEVVINELMPVNSTVVADQNGEYDDWFELYNVTPLKIDLSGYYLTDNRSNITKWRIPQGTFIDGNGFLIIWADKDTTQAGLHANFKLSSQGEELLISKPDRSLVDKVVYPAQSDELSFSRVQDGVGDFRWKNPTFNRSNSSK
jgi:hypothetical protein